MTTEVCFHYYVLPVARGALSLGICKHCGHERDFKNSFTDIITPKKWNHDDPSTDPIVIKEKERLAKRREAYKRKKEDANGR